MSDNPFEVFKVVFGGNTGDTKGGPWTHRFWPDIGSSSSEEEDEDIAYAVDEHTFPVLIPCKRCGDYCQRSWLEPDASWVHVEERVYVVDGTRNYDHEAQPDYIDGEVDRR